MFCLLLLGLMQAYKCSAPLSACLTFTFRLFKTCLLLQMKSKTKHTDVSVKSKLRYNQSLKSVKMCLIM